MRDASALDDFLFDLRGYLVLENALEPELLDALNAEFDAIPPLDVGQWYRNAQRRDYNQATGLEMHNCVEMGEPFEKADRPPVVDQLSASLLRRREIVCRGLVHRRMSCLGAAFGRASSLSIRVVIRARCGAATFMSTVFFAAGRSTS
jgi:hypothetical protein